MSDYRKAHAVRIWQDKLTREFEEQRSFLWEEVIGFEGPLGITGEEGEPIEWQNRAPKCVAYLADGSVLCLLGSLERWNKRWDKYFKARDTAALLPFLN
ncbi:hypothetical protein F0P96_10575 [Hymenobacter busanensis]|uniref:Uncharacterized protein n=1 Tax=Hymenobacter busanensis TaxID=2607656 RepID=A0A7L4ZYJ0_9BACT|nr:hypothetical protein [Hymenobacter busanensis]KAA9333405.1 hypothetical protein F0P96_10575 [Hymenobacter busanensis]QHJ07915.1 hypothetical protein GUY19_11730 [Hymenobacter busanensis]